MAEPILNEVANDNARVNISSDDDKTRNISSDSNNEASDPAVTPLTSAVNDVVEEGREYRDVSEESGHLVNTNDSETTVLEEQTETCHPVCDGYTAPPPDYEDFMLVEYYRNKGLVCSGSQTIPDACLCSCHHEMGRRNTLQNGQTLDSSYPLDTNGQSSSQNVPHSFNYGPQQPFQYGLGNYGIIQTTHNVTVHSDNSAGRPNTDCQTNEKDKTVKHCFLSMMALLVIAGIVFGVIAALIY